MVHSLRLDHINSTRRDSLRSNPADERRRIARDGIADDGGYILCLKKHIHNGLQGEQIMLSPAGAALPHEVTLANLAGVRLDDLDVMIVHDPQLLSLALRRDSQLWIWCSHID